MPSLCLCLKPPRATSEDRLIPVRQRRRHLGQPRVHVGVVGGVARAQARAALAPKEAGRVDDDDLRDVLASCDLTECGGREFETEGPSLF